MDALLSVLPYIQITLAVLLIGAVLMQQRGAGLGSAFGGGEGTVHYERRGAEKTLFHATFVIAIAFVLAVALPILVLDTTQRAPVVTELTEEATTTTEANILDDIQITTGDGDVLDVDTTPTHDITLPAADVTVDNSDETVAE